MCAFFYVKCFKNLKETKSVIGFLKILIVTETSKQVNYFQYSSSLQSHRKKTNLDPYFSYFQRQLNFFAETFWKTVKTVQIQLAEFFITGFETIVKMSFIRNCWKGKVLNTMYAKRCVRHTFVIWISTLSFFHLWLESLL